MNTTNERAGNFVIKQVAVAASLVAGLVAPSAWALGLGGTTVQSALGEVLRAEVDVTSLSAEEASNLRIQVASPEAYRSYGVDYNPVLPGTTVSLQRRADGTPYLRITSDRAVQEPFVSVILELGWNTGRLVREITLLFDPPSNRPAPAAPAAAPVISSGGVAARAPAAAPAPAPAPAPAAEAPKVPVRAPKAPAAAPAPAPAPAAAATAPSTAASEVKVRTGDTLSGIAKRVSPAGISLDQMLVGLYRANPQAFVNENMNRLRSGVVLAVPGSDELKSLSPAEARQVIQAQSADFGAYRQKLAAGVPEAKAEQPAARQSTGKVEAAVQDRKAGGAAPADQLKLDKKPATAAAPAKEDKVVKDLAAQDAKNRANELARNVEELKKLQAASASAAATKPPAAAPAPAPVAPTVAVAPPPAPAPASVASAPAAVAAASVPAVVASAAPVAASAVVAASAPASAPAVAAAPPAEEEGSFVSSLLENPLVLPLVGIGVILLAGWGLWRLRGQKKADGGETSFLESRLQPDSFFGASGGQRIDTRDATGAPSSMSYSLSQLDAIGDVDPVAEADVYLAYGRDLQAEEILKEAMRSNPDRLAIRTKLLEVYAKRRDTKGYELLATQLFGLTNGEGDDWTRAQELGRTIDPDNALYQPGGAPVSGDVAAPVHPAELLGASTMPQSVVPSPSRFQISRPGSDSGMDSGTPSLDVDLDLSGFEPDAADPDATLIRPAAAPAPVEPVADLDLDLPVVDLPEAASAPASAPAADAGLDFDLPDLDLPAVEPPAAEPAPAPQAAPDALSFDLGGLSLDLDAEPAAGPTTSPTPLDEETTAAQALPEVAGLDGMDMDGGDADADPLLRKLELAEEFRQIGDVEAARDLLQEVLEKAQGGLRTKAQGMLDSLN